MSRRLLPLLLMLLPLPTHAKSIYLERLDLLIFVRQDGVLEVTENQDYVFDGDWTGGYVDLDLTRADHYSDIQVSQGARAYERGSLKHRGGFIVQRVGSSQRIKWRSRENSSPPYRDTPVSFRVKYHVHGALNHRPDHEELSWQTTCPADITNVRLATITIRLPLSLPRNADVKATSTAFGGTSNLKVAPDNGISYRAASLPSRETVELRVRFPQSGLPRHISIARILNSGLAYPLYALTALATFLIMLAHYSSYGVDPHVEADGATVSAPPSHLSPAMAGTLIDERAGIKEILATIFDLAAQGYLRIQEMPLEHQETSITLLAWLEEAESYELTALQGLGFGGAGDIGDTIWLSSLAQRFHATASDMQRQMYDRAIEFGFFRASPSQTRTAHMIYAIATGALVMMFYLDPNVFPGASQFTARLVAAIASLSCLAYVIRGSGTVLTISAAIISLLFAAGLNPGGLFHLVGSGLAVGTGLLCGIIIGAFGSVMPARTLLGAQECARWQAFRDYLANVRQYAAAVRAQEIVDKYLPYAIAFGMERSLLHQLEEAPVEVRGPAWYTTSASYAEGTSGGVSGPTQAPSLRSMSDGFLNTLSSMAYTLGSSPSNSGGGGR